MEKIIAKASAAKTSQIKEMIETLNQDLSDAASVVFEALLTILESRLPEHEFVEFCETL